MGRKTTFAIMIHLSLLNAIWPIFSNFKSQFVINILFLWLQFWYFTCKLKNLIYVLRTKIICSKYSYYIYINKKSYLFSKNVILKVLILQRIQVLQNMNKMFTAFTYVYTVIMIVRTNIYLIYNWDARIDLPTYEWVLIFCGHTDAFYS